MSERKNVHPDHYETGGSGHQGEDVVQSNHREKLAREKAERAPSKKGKSRPPDDEAGDDSQPSDEP